VGVVLLAALGPDPVGAPGYDIVLRRNAALAGVERVFAFGPRIPTSRLPGKITFLPSGRFPRLGDLLRYAREHLTGRRCIVAGGGVLLDESVSYLERFELAHTCLLFGEWASERGPAPSAALGFRAPLPGIRAGFRLEAPGADVRLTHDLQRVGVTVRYVGTKIRAVAAPQAEETRGVRRVPGPGAIPPGLPPAGPRVIGVGLQRTGTGSLRRALNVLGIQTLEFYGSWYLVKLKAGHLVFDPAADHELFQGFADNPVPAVYREMDGFFPGSRFVLTTRDSSAWLRSVENLFEGKPRWQGTPQGDLYDACHAATYGVTSFDPEAFAEGYERHREEVLDYFSGRPTDLLVVDVSEPRPWDALCTFLGRPVPGVPYPHANRMAGSRWLFWKVYQRLMSVLRRRFRPEN